MVIRSIAASIVAASLFAGCAMVGADSNKIDIGRSVLPLNDGWAAAEGPVVGGSAAEGPVVGGSAATEG